MPQPPFGEPEEDLIKSIVPTRASTRLAGSGTAGIYSGGGAAAKRAAEVRSPYVVTIRRAVGFSPHNVIGGVDAAVVVVVAGKSPLTELPQA